MKLQDDVYELKKELGALKQDSFALEILSDYKKQNKRQFIIILTLIALWFATLCYLVYVLVDVGIVEETQTIEDVETIENSSINNGGNNG